VVPARREQLVPASGAIRRGTATWYCCTRGHGENELVAAAGAEIRVGDWRGRSVSVCAGRRCIRVKLVDWCGCPGNRIIDLHPGAFRQLAPLSSGIVAVTVRW